MHFVTHGHKVRLGMSNAHYNNLRSSINACAQEIMTIVRCASKVSLTSFADIDFHLHHDPA